MLSWRNISRPSSPASMRRWQARSRRPASSALPKCSAMEATVPNRWRRGRGRSRLLALAGAAVAEEALVLGAGVAGQGLDGDDAGAGEGAGDVALPVRVEVTGPRGGAKKKGT